MTSTPHARTAGNPAEGQNSLQRFFGVFRYTKRALKLVWDTDRPLSLFFGFVTVMAGLLPSGVAWIGARIVDRASLSARRCSRPSSRIA
jgi:ATP-binding cassette subfamily B protein